jgi:hypothetical protein
MRQGQERKKELRPLEVCPTARTKTKHKWNLAQKWNKDHLSSRAKIWRLGKIESNLQQLIKQFYDKCRRTEGLLEGSLGLGLEREVRTEINLIQDTKYPPRR